MSVQANISWTPAAGSAGQQIQYRVSGTPDWIAVVTLASTVTSYNLTGLAENTLYDIRVVNICQYGGPTPGSSIQKIKFGCPVLTIVPTVDTAAFSFNHTGASITKYVIQLINATTSTVITSVIKTTPSGTISDTFTGLTPSTTYKIAVIMYAGDTFSFSNSCLPESFTTSAPPVCNAPTSIVATLSAM